jgi:hypothetical protein
VGLRGNEAQLGQRFFLQCCDELRVEFYVTAAILLADKFHAGFSRDLLEERQFGITRKVDWQGFRKKLSQRPVPNIFLRVGHESESSASTQHATSFTKKGGKVA